MREKREKKEERKIEHVRRKKCLQIARKRMQKETRWNERGKGKRGGKEEGGGKENKAWRKGKTARPLRIPPNKTRKDRKGKI